MTSLYKKALIIGATSGIGEALALKLAANGTKIVGVGRRQDRLDALIAKAPAGTVATQTLDVLDLAAIPAFAKTVTAAHPDLDCVVFNSGIQRPYNFSKDPATLDLTEFDKELTTNYLSVVHLVTVLLPHLQTKARLANGRAFMVFIGATLGLVPFLVRTPGYNASKSALHTFLTALRQQQIDAGFADRLRIVEVFPPAVQTELHDFQHTPGTPEMQSIGMPLNDFTETLYTKLMANPELFVGIGPVESMLAEGGLEDQRQKAFVEQHAAAKERLKDYFKD